MPGIGSATLRQKELWDDLHYLTRCKNPTLRWILSGFESNFEQKIYELKTVWNQKIRTYYRDVLSLNTKNTPLTVTYRLDDNRKFIQLIENHFPELDFAELVAFKRYINEAEKVMPYFTDMVALESLMASKEHAELHLKRYDLTKIVKTLFDFYQRSPESDVFGRYYISKHTIEIYIIPCIIFSMLIEEDFLNMAVGTLAHELAHGFHHVGADKDDQIWETFANAEPSLLEGLAEFYTREFCKSITSIQPAILRTFDKTSKHLPVEYTKYLEWGDDFGLETIYQEFIETRRNDIRTFKEFHRGLNNTQKRLGQ